jgi:ubiquinone/menaquinone biosynthesis C-methylase UbiE
MKEAMYRDHARYYDLIYSFKDYKKETAALNTIIRKHKRSAGNDLLDVACGTGKHLEQFKGFSLHGSDLNKGILSIAKRRLQKAKFYTQDMAKLRIGKKFDVITCLFSSIGYVKTRSGLKRTIQSFAQHLKSGGVIIIEPWFTKEQYTSGTPHMTTYDSPQIKIARLNISDARGDMSHMDMHFTVAEKDKRIIQFVDNHEMLMTPHEEIIRMMEETGMSVTYLKTREFGRGLLIGIKSA